MPGVTVDTGFLIALERHDARAWRRKEKWLLEHLRVVAPAAILTEWYRAPKPHHRILAGIEVEPLTRELALAAGRALGEVGAGPSIVDATVMASAATRGDVVFTSDIEDFQLRQNSFPEVRLMRF